MTASRSVTLVKGWPGISQSFMASVSSAFQSFPLWKRQIAVSVRCGWAHFSNCPSGANARAVTTSALAGGTASMRPTTILGCFSSPMRRPASPRKAAFLASDSISVTSRSGRMAAATRPGNPAPLPRSVRVLAPGGIRSLSWAESRTWRIQILSMVALPTRLIAFCQRTSVWTNPSSWSRVSRETSTPICRISRTNRSRLIYAARRRTYFSKATKAAGVTPEIRAAWPKVAGLWLSSFWRTSFERLPTAP